MNLPAMVTFCNFQPFARACAKKNVHLFFAMTPDDYLESVFLKVFTYSQEIG